MGDSKVSTIGVRYAIRGMDAYGGAFFAFSKQPSICNPKCDVKYQFYLKVAAIVYGDPTKIEGKKCSEIGDTFRYTDDKMGSFVFYSKTMQKLRIITCARKLGFTRGIFPYGVGLLHSIIPRYDADKVIVGMYVHYDDYSKRKWTKFDGNFKGFKEHDGFTELSEDTDFLPIIESRLALEGVNFRLELGTFILYLDDNASLVMSDFTNPDLGDTSFRDRINTLFQSGSIIICKSNIEFRFYDKEEGEEVKPMDMLKSEYRCLMPGTVNYSKLTNGKNNFAIILKSTKSAAMWTLRVPRYKKPRYRMIKPTILGIPTGGQFEQVFDLHPGLAEMCRRMSEYKQWKKYVKRAFFDDENFEPFTYIASNSLYP